MGEGVALIANGETSGFLGLVRCRNSWYCPVCEPIKMNKLAIDLDCAINALKEWKQQIPIMVTLTVPHNLSIHLEHSMNVLFQATTKFFRRRNRISNIIGQFTKDYNFTHYAKVCEITWTNNGWHPHYHILIWIDKNKLNQREELLEYETKLAEWWRKLVETEWRKLSDKYDNDLIERMLINTDVELNPTHHAGLFISKDADGYIREVKTSDYICGWGAEREVTGNYRKQASHEGSMTMYQLLHSAIYDNDDKNLRRYFAFIRAVDNNKRHRFDFSKGLKAIINNWKNTDIYKQQLLKKLQSYRREWRTVAWFTKPLWYELQLSEYNTGVDWTTLLLYWANKPDAFERIDDLMRRLNLPAPERTSPIQSALDKLLNHTDLIGQNV